MRLPGLDVVFRFAAPAVDILVKYTGVADLQVGDDEACVGPFRASLDAGDDPLDAAPTGGPVEELLEAAGLALLRRGLEACLRAGLEALDVPAQRRGRRDAQDIIETIGSTPVEDFGTAIMAIGAQQYLGVGPVGPDRPQQAAQEGTDLLATRPFGGAKHSCDEAAFAVEYDDRLKTIFVVMRIEEPQLLAAMNRIERVVDVECDPFRDLPEGFAIKIDHGAAHAQQGASVGQVLQAGDGGL